MSQGTQHAAAAAQPTMFYSSRIRPPFCLHTPGPCATTKSCFMPDSVKREKRRNRIRTCAIGKRAVMTRPTKNHYPGFGNSGVSITPRKFTSNPSSRNTNLKANYLGRHMGEPQAFNVYCRGQTPDDHRDRAAFSLRKSWSWCGEVKALRAFLC